MEDTAEVDLHVHTTASDGTFTPEASVARAHAVGLKALGIADHDTMDGVAPALEAAGPVGLEIVPAVEINTDYGQREVHVLGYYADPNHPPLLALLGSVREARLERLHQILAQLERLGLPVPLERVLALAAGGPVGRPHVAHAMADLGYVRTVREAFERWLGVGHPAYVVRYKLEPREAVAAILDAGGVPVLAHPGLVARDEVVAELVEAGLVGLEVYHPDHRPGDVRRYLELADRLGLIVTGGSDCHGPSLGRPALLGTVRVPYELLRGLKAAHARLGAAAGRLEG